MSNYSENNDFNSILTRLLANIDDSLDKRQGSIIYDALAPAAAELAQCYIALDVYTDQTYLETAVGENLDLRAADYGIVRNPATPAIRIGNIYNTNNQLMDIAIGSRFAIPNSSGGYNFTVTQKISTGVYLFTCETAGIIGNTYLGDLLPLTTINNLGSATIVNTQIPGEDEESDDNLRERVKNHINQKAFAGNKASYLEYMDSLNGVGLAKVFPVWNGGGTVKIIFTTSDYTIPTSSFVNQIQTNIDPIANQGQGLGIAPIGHTVTVTAPTQYDIDISATLTLESGYTISQVQTAVREALANYIKEVQNEWKDSNTLHIYIARITAAILTVDKVTNVSNVTVNTQASDLTISVTANTPNYPMLGEVVLNAN